MSKLFKGIDIAPSSAFVDNNPPRPKGAVTIIAYGTNISNSVIDSECDLRIDGNFDGKIMTKGKLVLGEKCVAKGVFYCQSAEISGKAEGDIYVQSLTSLKNTGVFVGEIKTVDLCVDKGARIDGNIKFITEESYAKTMGSPFVKSKEDDSESEYSQPQLYN